MPVPQIDLGRRTSDPGASSYFRPRGNAKGLGVPVVTLEYDREETLAPALEGIDSVFMAGAQVLLHDSAARRLEE